MADLHPMEFGEILDGALTIFRRHLGLFVKLGVVALWLPVALIVYIQLAGGVEQHLFLYFVALIMNSFGGLFLTASAIRVISDSYMGRPPQLAEAVSLGASKIWPLFVVGFGKGIITVLLAGVIGVLASLTVPALAGGGGAGALLVVLLAIVGGCWFISFVLCGYAVTTPVVVLENLGGSFDAFGRSWDLTRGFKLKIFGICVLAFLMIYLPIMIIGGLGGYFRITSPLVGKAIEVFAAVLPVLVYPLFSCILTLIYYDLRVRREAFDLQVLGQQLGIS